MYSLDASQCKNLSVSTNREWILTNGIGGFAMGTVSGINTRRYHGHLVAAIRPPTDRVMLLSSIEAFATVEGQEYALSANQYPGTIFPDGYQNLVEFTVGDSADWRFSFGKAELVKSLSLAAGENRTDVKYSNAGSKAIDLVLRPIVMHRSYHENFYENGSYPSSLHFSDEETVINHGEVELVLRHSGADATELNRWYYRFVYERESERGLNDREDGFCPVELKVALEPGATFILSASTSLGGSQTVQIGEVHGAKTKDRLIAAITKFQVRSSSRQTIIAGYPWFTDWGRDTMISLPGYLCATHRYDVAKEIVLAYASQLRNGLVPNRFVEDAQTPDYNTADGTLWFVNASHYILSHDWDPDFASAILPKLIEVFDWHIKGTDSSIYVDPDDGLLSQGTSDTQLTWMDAKVGDHAITPRYGKAVEINGLWINALGCIGWLAQELNHHRVGEFEAARTKALNNFDSAFWNEEAGCFFDVIGDGSVRPNQVIAMALPYMEMAIDHCLLALEVVGRDLLTPFGLRTLSPNDSRYHPRFEGNMSERDSGYHQGTVWPWLLGSYATALVRYADDRLEAKRVLKQAKVMLEDYGLGGIAEVYDGDPPQRGGGCPWQAWSVCEILRALIDDVKD